MAYILDTGCFYIMQNFFPKRFPSYWDLFNQLVADERAISTREVKNEIDRGITKSHLLDWAEENRRIFKPPRSEESEFVGKIFQVAHFQYLLREKDRLKSGPEADPFVIAAAYSRDWCVVTEEVLKPNAAKIPNVCQHFNIDCINFEDLMSNEGWRF